MAKAYVLAESEGTLLMNGIPHLIKAGECALGRGIAAFTCETVAGEEPPLHVHTTEDEIFYVLSGELEFTCADEVLPAKAGSFVFLPQGKPHTYRILVGPAKLLVLTFPAQENPQGWGGYIASIETNGDFSLSTPPG